MVVGFTTTCAIGAYHQLNRAHSEMYLIQRYVIEFVRDLWQVGGFILVVVGQLFYFSCGRSVVLF